jgi:hypothetical protein
MANEIIYKTIIRYSKSGQFFSGLILTDEEVAKLSFQYKYNEHLKDEWEIEVYLPNDETALISPQVKSGSFWNYLFSGTQTEIVLEKNNAIICQLADFRKTKSRGIKKIGVFDEAHVDNKLFDILIQVVPIYLFALGPDLFKYYSIGYKYKGDMHILDSE